MKKIEAIIRGSKFEFVKEGLIKVGVRGMTAYEVKGRGAQVGNALSGEEGSVSPEELLPKMKLEIVCIEEELDKVLSTISSRAHTGQPGDGRIFVSNVNEIVKISTGQREKV